MVQGLPYHSGPERDNHHRYMNEHGVDISQPGVFLPPRLPASVAIETAISALRESNGEAPAEFAMIVLHSGQFRTFTSDGLRHCESRLFSDTFKEDVIQELRRLSHPSIPGPYSRDDRRQSYSSDSSTGRGSRRRFPRQRRDDFDSDESAFSIKRRRACSEIGEDDTPVPQVVKTKSLMIGDDRKVTEYYTQKFKDLQQTACKIIGKAFVKCIEPKKQTNHPYTGGPGKAPMWWPPLPKTEERGGAFAEGVRHKEPDHLYKKERIHLLVWILELITDRKHPLRPDTTRTVTIRELERVTNEVMTTFFKDGKHPAKQEILRELFRVAKKQEQYKDGGLDGTATVTVKHGDDCSDNEPDEGLEYNDEDENESQGMTPPDNIISPHTGHSQSSMPLRSQQMEPDYNLPMHNRYIPIEEPRYQENGLQNPSLQQQTFVPNGYPHSNGVAEQDASRRNATWPASYPSPPNQYPSWTSPPNNMVSTTGIAYGSYTPTHAPSSFHNNHPQLPPPGTMHRPVHPQQSYGPNDGLRNGVTNFQVHEYLQEAGFGQGGVENEMKIEHHLSQH